MSSISRTFEDLDSFDVKILRVMSNNARISVTDLAAEVGLSKTPCHIRLKRLESSGYIQGYFAQIDMIKLGLNQVSFVEVKLSDTRARALEEFSSTVRKLAAVEQCHMIAGGFDYLLKIRTQDMSEYRTLLGEVISQLPHVAQTSTYVSMEAVKEISVLSV